MTEYFKLIHYVGGEKEFFHINNISGEIAEFSMEKVGTPTVTPVLEYSLNGTDWTSYDFTNLPTVNIPVDGKIYFRGTNTGVFSNSTSNYFKFHCNKSYNIEGNIMSIYDYANISTVVSLPRDSMFRCLFYGETNLIDAKGANIGKVTNASRHNSFHQTFQGCTALKSAMNLSSIINSDGQNVFGQTYKGCSSLIDPGEYNAKHATNYTWNECFRECTSLKKAPDLSCIKQWGDMGISGMFYGDIALEKAPCFGPQTSWGGQPIGDSIFKGCTSLVEGADFRNFNPISGTFRINNLYDGCTSLKTIYLPYFTNYTAMSDAFKNVSNNQQYSRKIYIPYGMVLPYQSSISTWNVVNY